VVALRRPRETFAALLRRYDLDTRSARIVDASLATVLATGDDPLCVVAYLATLGISVRNVSDLLQVNALDDEEELGAHPVREGVAISIASEGSWVLFRP
jgi:hypothetical protein